MYIYSSDSPNEQKHRVGHYNGTQGRNYVVITGDCRGGHVGTRVRRAGAEAPARGRVRAGAVTGFVSDAIAMQLTKPNVTAPASRMED